MFRVLKKPKIDNIKDLERNIKEFSPLLYNKKKLFHKNEPIEGFLKNHLIDIDIKYKTKVERKEYIKSFGYEILVLKSDEDLNDFKNIKNTIALTNKELNESFLSKISNYDGIKIFHIKNRDDINIFYQIKNYIADLRAFIESNSILKEMYHLSDWDKIKKIVTSERYKKLMDIQAIVLNDKKSGKITLGVSYPTGKISFTRFNDICYISGDVIDWNFNTSNLDKDLTLDNLLKEMELKGYSNIDIIPRDDDSFNIHAMIDNQAPIIRKEVHKDKIDEIYKELRAKAKINSHSNKSLEIVGLKYNIYINGEYSPRNYRMTFGKFYGGFDKCSIRILPTEEEIRAKSYKDYGYLNIINEINIEIFKKIENRRSGIYSVIGEPNNGKSTLMYKQIIDLVDFEKYIILSIEHPKEVSIKGVAQNDLNDSKDASDDIKRTYDNLLEEFLTSNPHFVYMQEVRNELHLEKTLLGVLEGIFFSYTFHADSIRGAIDRTEAMLRKTGDVGKYMAIYKRNLSVLIAIELINKKCHICNGSGYVLNNSCEQCNGKGESGRVPVLEIGIFNLDDENRIDSKDDIRDFAALIKNGKLKYTSKREYAKKLLDSGVITETRFNTLFPPKRA